MGTGEKEKTDENSGHYVIASSQPPECQPLERLMHVPIFVDGWTEEYFENESSGAIGS